MHVQDQSLQGQTDVMELLLLACHHIAHAHVVSNIATNDE